MLREPRRARGRSRGTSRRAPHRTFARAAVTALAVGGLILSPRAAHAYCRTTTCDPQTQDCTPSAGQSCVTIGLPLYWPVACSSYSLHQAAAPNVPLAEFSRVAAASFSAWTAVACDGGAKPSIRVVELGPIPCPDVVYRCPSCKQTGGNANTIVFRTDVWPYPESRGTLALTTVTFNTQTGEIYDVDMEINDVKIALTTGDMNVQYDLQSIITHEAGHFYGLAHTPDTAATMYEKYKAGTTTLRILKTDDIQGMCAIYPPGRQTGACDATPRHGFQGDCVMPAEERCCSSSVAPASSSRTGRSGLAVLLIGGLLWWARRTARGRNERRA
jgi:hypothetical protein